MSRIKSVNLPFFGYIYFNLLIEQKSRLNVTTFFIDIEGRRNCQIITLKLLS